MYFALNFCKVDSFSLFCCPESCPKRFNYLHRYLQNTFILQWPEKSQRVIPSHTQLCYNPPPFPNSPSHLPKNSFSSSPHGFILLSCPIYFRSLYSSGKSSVVCPSHVSCLHEHFHSFFSSCLQHQLVGLCFFKESKCIS